MSLFHRPLSLVCRFLESPLGIRALSTTSTVNRWHKDYTENRMLRRYGYKDTVKMSGPLPRLSEDSPRIDQLKIFTPFNPWAPKRALFGQNDYIDILGDDPDAIKPHDQHYHIPRHLRGLPVSNHNDYQMALKRKQHLARTAYPKMMPYQWDMLQRRVTRDYRKLKKTMNQFYFANYRGITVGVAPNPFKTKHPF